MYVGCKSSHTEHHNEETSHHGAYTEDGHLYRTAAFQRWDQSLAEAGNDLNQNYTPAPPPPPPDTDAVAATAALGSATATAKVLILL